MSATLPTCLNDVRPSSTRLPQPPPLSPPPAFAQRSASGSLRSHPSSLTLGHPFPQNPEYDLYPPIYSSFSGFYQTVALALGP